MPRLCPYYRSEKIVAHNYGKKLGGTIGTAAGIASTPPL